MYDDTMTVTNKGIGYTVLVLLARPFFLILHAKSALKTTQKKKAVWAARLTQCMGNPWRVLLMQCMGKRVHSLWVMMTH